MKLTEMTDNQLLEISKQKIKTGKRKGCYTSEANRAIGILRARHNSFIDCGFKNLERNHSYMNGPVIIINKEQNNA